MTFLARLFYRHRYSKPANCRIRVSCIKRLTYQGTEWNR